MNDDITGTRVLTDIRRSKRSHSGGGGVLERGQARLLAKVDTKSACLSQRASAPGGSVADKR